MRFHKKQLGNKKLDFNKIDLDNDGTEEWLGKELVEEGNKLLNDCLEKEEIIVRFLIAKNNWNIAMKEIKELEEQNKKLDVQIQILKRD